jgi:hypothetical protein
MINIGEATRLLMKRAGPHLTDEDLLTLGGASDLAHSQAANLATVMDGMAALIANDDGGGWISGKKDVAAMLWHLSGVAESISALIDMGDDAEVMRTYRTRRPQSEKAAES